jgi:hypothetical protein
VHVCDVEGNAAERALVLEKTPAKRIGGINREEALSTAAETYLKLGNIKKYCEIMIELEHWEKALSVAPAVSIEYWRELTGRYGDKMAGKESIEAVPYYVATAVSIFIFILIMCVL